MGRGVEGRGAPWLAIALCAALAAGCGDAPIGDAPIGDAPSGDARGGDARGGDAQGANGTVGDDAASTPGPTPAGRDSLRSALRSLVAGPSAEARARGAESWFSAETRGVLRSVEVDAGRVVVDFGDSLPRLIPGAGSSAGSEALLAALDSTVFQFPWAASAEYRLGGSCAAFWEWLQRECTIVRP